MAYRIEGKDLVISGFEKGIADDPYKGISDMRNVNFSSIPGEASVAFSTNTTSLGTVSGTLASADTGTEIVTFSGLTGTLANYTAVIFAGAGLPTGVTAGTVYYLGAVSGLTAKLYTRGDLTVGSLVNITANGTGTFASVDMAQTRYFTTQITTTTGIPTYKYFAIDTNGRVWNYYDTASRWVYLNNTVTGADYSSGTYGSGIIVYHAYLFIWRSTRVDYIPLADIFDSTKWKYSWDPATGESAAETGFPGVQISNISATAGSSTFPHECLVGTTDDVWYSCDGPYLQSISIADITVAFNPTITATYVWNQKALALPQNDSAQCLAVLGTTLLIGGVLNVVYSWDRTSVGYLPLYISETYVKSLVTVNTNSYIFAGRRGRIYVTNGAQVQIYKQLPDHLAGTVEPYFSWGGATSDRNCLYFGVSATNNAGTAINQYGGLWMINMDDSSMCLLNRLSYGTYAGIASAILPRLQNTATTPPLGYGLFIGWDSGVSTYGIDAYSGNPYVAGESYIDSDIIPIGTFINPFTPTQVEWKTSTPLVSGETIELKYRTNLTDTYTTIGTTSLTQLSDMFQTNFQKAQWIQLRVVLTGTVTTPSYCRLTEIRIRETK